MVEIKIIFGVLLLLSGIMSMFLSWYLYQNKANRKKTSFQFTLTTCVCLTAIFMTAAIFVLNMPV